MPTVRPMKPYLINAVLQYCRDTDCSPYLMVAVDDCCSVPTEFVTDGRIIFDLSDEAIHNFTMDDDELSFQARFGENNRIFTVVVPLNRIIAVTPLEHQEFAMQFEVLPSIPREGREAADAAARAADENPPKPSRRPMRVK